MTTQYTVGVRFTGNSSSLNSAARDAVAAEREVGRAGQQAGDQATRGLKPITSTVDGIGASMRRTLGTLVAGIGVVQTVRSLASMADQYSNIGAQLRLASAGTVSFAQAQEQALGVAQRTASSLQATSDLVGKLATSFRSMGGDAKTSFNVAVGLSETISQAVALSGASAEAAKAAIMQLGQGMASGVLRGKELNSVMEQTPRLAQAIAAGMGVTVGQLRAMGAQGKITIQQLVEALLKQRDTLATEYSQLPLTIGRAWSQLQNSVLSYVGKADQANSVSRKMADAISTVANHIDDVARAVVTLGQVVATVYAGKMLYAGAQWIASLAAQSAAVAANGAAVTGWAATTAASFKAAGASMGLLGIAFNVLGAAIVGWQIGTYLREQFLQVRIAGIALVEGLLVAWERIKEGALIAWAGVKAGWEITMSALKAGAREAMGIIATILRGQGNLVAANWMDQYAASIKTGDSALADFAATSKEVHAATDANVKAIHDNMSGLADYEIAQENAKAATKGTAAAQDDLAKQAKKLLAEMKDGTAATRDQGAANKAAAEAARELARANAEIASGQATLDEQITQLRDKLAGLSDQQIEYNAGVREAVQLYQGWVRSGVPVQQAMQDLQARYDALNDRLQTKNQLDLQNNQATPETVKSYGTQTSAAERYYQVISEGAKTAADAIGNYFVRNVRSVKDLWRGLVDAARNVVAQIISTWLQLRVLQPLLAGVFGGGGGGWVGMAGSLLGAAVGGGGGGGGGGGVVGGGGATGGGNSYGGMLSNISTARSAYNYLGGGGISLSGGHIVGNSIVSGPGLGGAGTAYNMPNGAVLYQNGTSVTPYSPYGGTASMGGYAVPYASIGGGLMGAYYGAHQGDGSFGTAGSTVAYGALGAGIAGTAAGVAGGASVGAAAGGAFGAAAGMSWIPIVGWIAALAALVDHFSGGKVFGTKYRTDASAVDLNIGPDGSSADASVHQWKYRSQLSQAFGRALVGGMLLPSDWGDKDKRFKSVATTPEMTAAAKALYDNIEKTLVKGAQQLGVTAPAMIEATLSARSTYDKKGKLKSTDYVVEYLGRTWKEATADAAAQRLGAEALVTVVAQSAGAAAQQVAEQFRGSVETLMAGAQLMIAVQGDINKGNSLLALGATATLAQVVAFVQQMQNDGEALADTYTRLAQASAQYLQFVGQFKPAGVGFAYSLQQINQQMTANIDQANQLAVAAGLSGAREEDLANIHRYAAQQAADAITALSAASQDLATKLYGSVQSLASATAITAQLTSKLQASTQLAIGQNSPLGDKAKLDIALKGLRSGITSADDVLAIGRRLYASSADYTGLYNKVTEILGLSTATGGSEDLGAALTNYNKLYAQAGQMSRFNDAKQLAQNIADISSVQGVGYNEIAGGLGVNLQSLAKDLGLTNIAGYLDTLKQQDVGQTMATSSATIVDAIRGIGHDIVAAILGGPVVVPGATSATATATPTADQLALLASIDARLAEIQGSSATTANTNTAMVKQGITDDLRTVAGSRRSALENL